MDPVGEAVQDGYLWIVYSLKRLMQEGEKLFYKVELFRDTHHHRLPRY